jgi:hypothetical protein
VTSGKTNKTRGRAAGKIRRDWQRRGRLPVYFKKRKIIFLFRQRENSASSLSGYKKLRQF